MRNFGKDWWGIAWRLLLLTIVLAVLTPYSFKFSPVVLLSLIGAVVLHLQEKTLADTPLKNIARWRSPFIDSRRKPRRYTEHKTYAPQKYQRTINRATNNGPMTGFEPRFLDTTEIPSTVRMHGNPGSGLNSAHNVMTSSNIKAGQKGEVNFSKAMKISDGTQLQNNLTDGLIHRVETFWSVAMPDENNPRMRDSKYNTDIDCIVVSGNRIILIDTKLYKSGDVTYYNEGNMLYCRDNATGNQVGEPKKMSRNMSMAVERFKKLYPSYDVSAYVVLMPTDSGTANIDRVYFPGHIPMVHPTTILSHISIVADRTASPYIVENLRKLLK